MIALLDPPPKVLLDRAKSWSDVRWSRAFPNPEGKLCQTAREYYGGPFFESDGKCSQGCYADVLHVGSRKALTFEVGVFTHQNLIPKDISLADSVTSLEGEGKRLFFDFMRKMLQWLPEDRKTAKELLNDLWLASEPDE